MTPYEFIEKWGPGGPAYTLNERAGAQPHFMDLCALLDVPTPGDADNYCFERGVTKTGTGQGFADVWKRGCFALEYKAPGKSLEVALRQLMMYTLPLDNPPLLLVSDRLRIEIHTHFTGTPSEKHVILLEDLTRPEVQEKLRWIFRSPDRFKPARTNQQITEEAARTFAGTADRLRSAGVPAEKVSHFLTQCLFCFFAEDVSLLPSRLFERLVGVQIAPDKLQKQLENLFQSMRNGGLFGVDDIPWFNGGLFANIEVPALSVEDVKALRTASSLNWSAIDPSIFGTLFERGLDPSKRSQLGAHYTNPETIMRLVNPVVKRPLMTEWSRVAARIGELIVKRDTLREGAKRVVDKVKYARTRSAANEAEREAQKLFNAYLERLKEFRVLDPACGSGNFLYLSLKALKDIEHAINLEAESLGLQRQVDVTGPHNVLGIEINEFAAELARVTVWIGELQWRVLHGYAFKTNPILEPLDCIENRDAVLNADGTQASWPTASVVVGNPPFVGNKKMNKELGLAYTKALRDAYRSTVPGGVDFVCYWFDKARRAIVSGGLGAAGLVSTQSVRNGTNRSVLDAINQDSRIFEAWSNEEWWDRGASVRVSMTCFGAAEQEYRLDGREVPIITTDLKGSADYDLTTAVRLQANQGVAFQGPVKVGAFDIDGDLARLWLMEPNPSGVSNSDVLKPWANGDDVTGRGQGKWIIDFGSDMSVDTAAQYLAPFAHVEKYVKSKRLAQGREGRKTWWWLHGERVPGLRRELAGKSRYIATSRVSRNRFFVWMPIQVWPDSRLYAIARDDEVTFGVLSSRIHETWSLGKASSHGVGNDPTYNAEACFETFPFPPAGAHDADITAATKELNRQRDAWLNPPEWTVRVGEVVPVGMATSPYPDRVLPVSGFEQQLKARTLTVLYTDNPAWLRRLNERLDVAVARAYGWDDYTAEMPDDEILIRLMALNQERSQAKAMAGTGLVAVVDADSEQVS